MNILIYTHLYPSPEKYGIAPDTKVVHYFARDWQRMGHNVRVVLLNHWPVKEILRHDIRLLIPHEDDYVYENIPVHIFNYQLLTPRKRHPEHFQVGILNKKLKEWKQTLGWKPDKVFVHFPTFFVGLNEIFSDRVPSIGVFHLSDVINLKLDSSAYVRSFLGKFQTWGYRNRQIQQYLDAQFGRSSVPVYSGIDSSLIADEDFIRAKSSSDHATLSLLYAGSLISRKRADDLIRAVKQTTCPCTLTVIGDGPERQRFQELAAGDDRIVFLGKLSREETVAHMAKADVFLMVSTGETFGLVYLEAMWQGCLTVASRGEGIDGILQDGKNGFLVQPGNVTAIKETIERIYRMSPAEKKEILYSGWELASEMTSEKTSQKYLEMNR